MGDAKKMVAGVVDEAVGLGKRALGELTARPDFVLDGEKQQAEGHAEVQRARSSNDLVMGWKLDTNQRAELLRRFPPHYANVVADHVTLRVGVTEDSSPSPPVSGAVVGRIDDGLGVEALVVVIDGSTGRPDGGTFHVTWSLASGRRASESNDALSRSVWERFTDPVPLILHPVRFYA